MRCRERGVGAGGGGGEKLQYSRTIPNGCSGPGVANIAAGITRFSQREGNAGWAMLAAAGAQERQSGLDGWRQGGDFVPRQGRRRRPPPRTNRRGIARPDADLFALHKEFLSRGVLRRRTGMEVANLIMHGEVTNSAGTGKKIAVHWSAQRNSLRFIGIIRGSMSI